MNRRDIAELFLHSLLIFGLVAILISSVANATEYPTEVYREVPVLYPVGANKQRVVKERLPVAATVFLCVRTDSNWMEGPPTKTSADTRVYSCLGRYIETLTGDQFVMTLTYHLPPEETT